MTYRHPAGFPEASVLGAMRFRKPMTVGEILAVGPFRRYSNGKSNYPVLKQVLGQLMVAGWVDQVIRKPRTGRPAMCYRRIAALPR